MLQKRFVRKDEDVLIDLSCVKKVLISMHLVLKNEFYDINSFWSYLLKQTRKRTAERLHEREIEEKYFTKQE